jgi:hypothetical protein
MFPARAFREEVRVLTHAPHLFACNLHMERVMLEYNYIITLCMICRPDMGLEGKSAPAPSTGGVLQARLRREVQNKPQTHHRSCSRLGDARVTALRIIVQGPCRTALTPHEASVGVSPTKISSFANDRKVHLRTGLITIQASPTKALQIEYL